MSAINFCLTNQFVIISSDIVASDPQTKLPVMLHNKFHLLPHMNCVICGVGDGNAILDWYLFVWKNVVARGIETLNRVTRERLKSVLGEKSLPCTIYQFGLDENRGTYRGFAYRDTNDYVSEELLADQLYCRPEVICESFGIDESTDMIKYITDLLSAVMRKQKADDEIQPQAQRVGIGGINQMLIMSKDCMAIQNIEYFDDYRAVFNDICARTIKSR